MSSAGRTDSDPEVVEICPACTVIRSDRDQDHSLGHWRLNGLTGPVLSAREYIAWIFLAVRCNSLTGPVSNDHPVRTCTLDPLVARRVRVLLASSSRKIVTAVENMGPVFVVTDPIARPNRHEPASPARTMDSRIPFCRGDYLCTLQARLGNSARKLK